MIKQIVLNGAVNDYTLLNRPAGWVSLNYDTVRENLILKDTYNNIDTIITLSGQIGINPLIKQWIKQLQEKIHAGIAGAFRFRGSVNSYEELLKIPNPDEGQVYQIKDKEYAYNKKKNEWVELGFNMDLSSYSTTEQIIKRIQDALKPYYTKTQVNTTISTYIKTNVNPILEQLNKKIDALSGNAILELLSTKADIVYVDQLSSNIMTYINQQVYVKAEHLEEVNQKIKQINVGD